MSMKDDYFTMMVSQFKRWDAEFGMLTAMGGQMSDGASALVDEQRRVMLANRDAAYKLLQEIRAASEAAWRSKQAGVDAAWDSMKHALDKVSSQVKKQR
jgi:phage terminase small subunit